jgi:hypothetical protein
MQGIVHKEFVPPGQTVNGKFYREVLKWLRKGIRRKRPYTYVGTLLSEYSDKSSTGVFEHCLHFFHDATTDLFEHYCHNLLISNQLVYLSSVFISIMMPQLICWNTTVTSF